MEQTQQDTASRSYRSGPLRKISAPDMHLAVELFVDAAATLTPDDQTQRKAFESLMPNMYVLRNKGVSWAQLTDLLTKAGFRLQVSTVRTYYSEMLMRKFDACQERLNEQIVLLKAIKKETEGVDMQHIAHRVSSVVERNRAAVAPKLAQILGEPAYAPRVPSLTSETRPESAAGSGGQGPAARRAAPRPSAAPTPPPRPAAEKSAGSHYGLEKGASSTAPTGKNRSQTAGFQNPDDNGPTVPDLPAVGSRNQPPARPQGPPSGGGAAPDKQCMALKPGVPALKPRADVPQLAYQAGQLEHPAIPGLMLSLEQRLYGLLLEYKSLDTGEVFFETTDEKRFRVLWKAPIPKTQTSTAKSFIETDMSLFKRGDGGTQ